MALVFCVYFELFFCVLVFYMSLYFWVTLMLSIAVQLIFYEDRPQNDLLCVERDVKQLLTHSRHMLII